ncbi:MAG TPA: murein L,D-transpeptidase catalytic domain family protein [Gemmatimonadaceae bacterium]|nr:murein L,D-transpeptidase catalytic domain family protein [Gemmatimonadaceae bacterium]
MRASTILQNALLGASALLIAGAHFVPDRDHNGPVLDAAVSFVGGSRETSDGAIADSSFEEGALAGLTRSALAAFTGAVRPLSRPEALESAFRSYFAYKAAHPNEVRKPFLYFVDYGLPNTAKRGYVFDMESMRVVDGPFTVAAGRGSAPRNGVPTRFSNASGSNATSLGLYVAKSIYDFRGKSAGKRYSSLGLRLMGVSTGFNDKALARGVVAHGAPYVTSTKAGRSEGCPAMEPERAERLLPKLAEGGMVFLFAPDEGWLSRDPWITAAAS